MPFLGANVTQGDRCRSANSVCSSETGPGICIPCGGLNGRCCEAKISQVTQRTGLQPLTNNTVCSESRNATVLRMVPDRCPSSSITPSTQRCSTFAGAVCQSGIDPYTPGPAMCIPCGGDGQACCEGNRCNSFRSRCMEGGAGGVNGTCAPCGGMGEKKCLCGGPTVNSEGCVPGLSPDINELCFSPFGKP